MPEPLRWIAGRRWTASAALALALVAVPAAAQESVTVAGTVVDAQSGEPVAGVLVQALPGERRAVTDAEGRFTLRLRAGGYTVRVSQLGYAEQEQAVSVDAAAPAALAFALQPEPLVLERLNVVLDRFATRRNSVAMSTRVLDRRRLALSGAHSLVDVVAGAAVPVVPCRSGGALSLRAGHGTGVHCVYNRGRVIAPAVFIDDRPAFGGMDELAMYGPGEMHHLEIYGMGRMIRAYTLEYVDAVARGRRPLESIASFLCNGC